MTAALFILTVLLLYGCYLVARPFLTTPSLAIAIAVAAFPLHRWISRKIKARCERPPKTGSGRNSKGKDDPGSGPTPVYVRGRLSAPSASSRQYDKTKPKAMPLG